MLDTFKREYVGKLRHRVLFSGDLDIDGVRQDMDMNIELLRDILSKEVGSIIKVSTKLTTSVELT